MSDDQTSDLSENSNWGRWGPEDERGALNLLTPETVLAGMRAAKTGKVYNLGLPIQRQGSAPIFDFRNAPQRLTTTNPGDPAAFVHFGATPDVGSNEDVLVIDSHALSHMDALSHVFAQGSLYNGFSTDTIQTSAGTSRCGIDKVGGIAARGVLLDLPRHFGVDWLEPGYVITSADLQAAADSQGVSVLPGDVLLVRTGFLDYWHSLGEPTDPIGQAGIGFDAVSFIRDHDVSVVGMDNSAIEPIPFDRDIFLGVHIELLVKLGVHLLEHLNLNDLAADEVGECFVVVAPLSFTGAAGSPINPIVIG
jgi:kynurenine formamidase